MKLEYSALNQFARGSALQIMTASSISTSYVQPSASSQTTCWAIHDDAQHTGRGKNIPCESVSLTLNSNGGESSKQTSPCSSVSPDSAKGAPGVVGTSHHQTLPNHGDDGINVVNTTLSQEP